VTRQHSPFAFRFFAVRSSLLAHPCLRTSGLLMCRYHVSCPELAQFKDRLKPGMEGFRLTVFGRILDSLS
jgi:hypothetical protein